MLACQSAICRYANLPDNFDGFWVEKFYVEKRYNPTNRCTFFVYYRGSEERRYSISEAKQALLDEFKRRENMRMARQSGLNPAKNKLGDKIVFVT